LKNPLPELQSRQLDGFIDRLVTRLFTTEVHDWGAISRRETGDTDGLLEFLWEFREQFGPWALELSEQSDSAFRFLSARFVRFAYEQNQFFELDERAARKLSRAHRVLWKDFGSILHSCETIEEFARRANRDILHFVERLSTVFSTLGNSTLALAKGAEYSVELQLSILGIKGKKLVEPVVDLGCGKQAELVNYLRTEGVDATGIDRLSTAPFVLNKDWFDIRFEPGSLGTIVSHLAFSLQFLYHHWHPGDKAYAYAKKYMELLQSLKPRGLFVYSPGLPFIESMLEEHIFRVEKRPLPEPLATQMESYRDLGTGQSVAYVAHIERR
jgi:hypothetical protein